LATLGRGITHGFTINTDDGTNQQQNLASNHLHHT